jgi:hypothetical protein
MKLSFFPPGKWRTALALIAVSAGLTAPPTLRAQAPPAGAGTDREYFETNQGKLIDAKGVKARYVRLYSRGSTDSALNEYTEVEIYARPAQ